MVTGTMPVPSRRTQTSTRINTHWRDSLHKPAPAQALAELLGGGRHDDVDSVAAGDHPRTVTSRTEVRSSASTRRSFEEK
jgi:hypothetical protein